MYELNKFVLLELFDLTVATKEAKNSMKEKSKKTLVYVGYATSGWEPFTGTNQSYYCIRLPIIPTYRILMSFGSRQ